jgi:hypothetical protein
LGIRAPPSASKIKPSPLLLPFGTMLSKLAKRKDAAPFAKPMRELWAPEELVSYFQIIKQPMDMRTVVEKLRAGEYNSGGHEAFAADVRLVFKNCMTYTPSQASPYHQQAKALLAIFDNVRSAAAATRVPSAPHLSALNAFSRVRAGVPEAG